MTKRLRLRRTLSNVICDAMDRERGFIFIENVYYNGKDFVCFNIVSSEQITTFDFDKKRQLKLLLQNRKLRIKCDAVVCTFVGFKSVELLPPCVLNDSSRRTSTNSGAANIDSEKVMNEIVLSGTTHISIAQKSDEMDLHSSVQWNQWTATQVNKWIEMELRKGMKNLNISEIIIVDDDNCNDQIDRKQNEDDKNANNQFEFVDEEQEILADKFMTKFKSLSISGSVLLEMKNNDKLMNKAETIMSELSCVFWFIVSTAIDGLELQSNNNNKAGLLDAHEDVEVVLVAQKSDEI